MQIKQYKKEFDYSYSIGVYPTIELLTYHPKEVLIVILSSKSEANAGVHKILELCAKHNIQTDFNDQLISKLGTDNSYALGVFNKYSSDLNSTANSLVLVNPSDSGNLGTICRTMLAFDVPNLAVISPAVDIFDPKTIRASMGALFALNYSYFDNFKEYSSNYKNPIYSFMTNGSHLLNNVKFNTPCTLVFGSEGAGLSDDYLKFGTSIQIPQSDKVDSLNLAVSIGISLYTVFSN